MADVFVAREVDVEKSSATCEENEPRYRRHPSSTDCQLYVACVTGPDGRYVPVVMRCLLGLQWDDQSKMCVANSHTCHDDHVIHDHVIRDHVHTDHVATDHAHAADNHAHFDASWLEADRVFHRRQPAASNDEHRRHPLRHFRHNDVIY